MDKKNVDEYVVKIITNRDEKKRIEITREFFEQFYKSIFDIRKDGTISGFKNGYEEILQYCIDRGAFDVSFEIGYKHIPELVIKYFNIVQNDKKIDFDRGGGREGYKESYRKKIGELLNGTELLTKDGKVKNFDDYDTYLTAYMALHTKNNIKIDDIAKSSFEIFMDNLPKEKTIKEARTGRLIYNSVGQEGISEIIEIFRNKFYGKNPQSYVDEYIKKIVTTRDDEKRIEITKEFFEQFDKSVFDTKEDGTIIGFKEGYGKLLQYCIDKGAFDLSFDIGCNYIPELARKYVSIVQFDRKVNFNRLGSRESYKESYIRRIGNLLNSKELLTEDGKVKDFDAYDTYLTTYMALHTMNNKKIDDIAKSSFEIFMDNVPKGKKLIETKTFGKQIKNNEDKEDILEIKKIAYDKSLYGKNSKYLDENQEIIDIHKYDKLLNNYLAIFGKGNLSYKDFATAYKKLIEKWPIGLFSNSQTYSEFRNQYKENNKEMSKFLALYNEDISKDIIGRLHEKDPIQCEEWEYDIFNKFYMDHDDTNGRLKDFISNLAYNENRNSKAMAQSVVRVQNDPDKIIKDKNMKKIYNYIKSIDVIDLLKENLDIDKIKSGDKQYIQSADYAIKLICERDFEQGAKLLTNPELVQAFEDVGINIYDTDAMKKYVELYVDTPELHENKEISINEEIIRDYLKHKCSKPDFNYLKEQGVSDIMQLCDTKNTYHEKIFRDALENTSNEAYKKAQDSKEVIDNFLNEFDNKTILPKDEKKFEEFLSGLSTLKIINGYPLDQKYIKFLMKQAMNKKSIINQDKEKYGFVVERALEDLGKNDFIEQNNGKKPTYLYCTRDYIRKTNTTGLHKITGSKLDMKQILIKKERAYGIFKGDTDPIGTIYHENTHIKQHVEFDKIPSTYEKYNMIREQAIMSAVSSYYGNNYEYTYMEIEAREIGAKKAAQFIASIIPKNQVGDIAEQVKNDVVDLFSNQLLEEKNRKEKEAFEEHENYKKGEEKILRKGEDKRTVSEILNHLLKNKLITSSEFKSLVETYPALRIEYMNDGTRRSFSDLMLLGMKQGRNLDMMRQIIKNSNTISIVPTNSNGLGGIIDCINYAKTDEQKKFINDVLSENLGIFFQKYMDSLYENQLYTSPFQKEITKTRVYRMYAMIKDIKQNEDAFFMEGLKRVPQDENGIQKSPYELMNNIEETIGKYFPEVVNDYKWSENKTTYIKLQGSKVKTNTYQQKQTTRDYRDSYGSASLGRRYIF